MAGEDGGVGSDGRVVEVLNGRVTGFGIKLSLVESRKFELQVWHDSVLRLNAQAGGSIHVRPRIAAINQITGLEHTMKNRL